MSDKGNSKPTVSGTAKIANVHGEVPNIRFSAPPPPPKKKWAYTLELISLYIYDTTKATK